MLTLEEKKAAVKEKSEELMFKFGQKIKANCKFSVSFFSNSTKGGTARITKSSDGVWLCLVEYNEALLDQNFDEYMNVVVPHEVAHCITKIAYPNAKQGHGPEWKMVCRMMGGTGERTHSMDCEAAGIKKRNVQRLEYTCGCSGKIHLITKNRHTKILNGSRYRCNFCNQRIEENF